MVNKLEADGGLLGFYHSGIQKTISVGKTDHNINLSRDDKNFLLDGTTIDKKTACASPIYSSDNLVGIIYIFQDPETRKPLSQDLVQAYALLSAQNLQMKHKQDHLAKYADSLVEKRQELEKIQQYNQNLLSITTHDLSSPLNAISGYLDLVEEHLDSNENQRKIQKYYRQIQSGVNDVSNMLEQLNEVIKFKKGFLQLDSVKVDINWIVRDVAELLQGKAKSNDINLEIIMSEHPIYVDIDIIKFKRIVDNLISNAIKYTDSGNHIFVRISADDENVQVKVKDEGIGISQEKLNSIFQPFVKLDKSRKDMSSHSQGLGLYISSYFVELMDGKIIVQSKSGKGSTFTIQLPRIDSALLHRKNGNTG